MPESDNPEKLRKEPCPHRGGRGKKPIRCNGRLLRYVTDMVEALDAIARAADRDAKERVFDQVEGAYS
jgi:hypothetical protein